jgi:hypothetical protein
MNASVLVAFAGVFLFAAICVVLAWMAGSAIEQSRAELQVPASSENLDGEEKAARELLGAER